MTLNKDEREVVIQFDEAGDIARVYTASTPWKQKLAKLNKEFPDEYRLIRKDKYGASYEIPKNLISIRRPRKMTEAQKMAIAKRLSKARENI
jgi:hypothetical protein